MRLSRWQRTGLTSTSSFVFSDGMATCRRAERCFGWIWIWICNLLHADRNPTDYPRYSDTHCPTALNRVS